MTSPAASRLTLGTVDVRCQLVGAASDVAPVRSRLDQVAREGLPQAIASALRLSFDEAEVVRIERIDLDLVLSREDFQSAALSRIWGDRIAGAIAAALARTDHPAVARFPGPAEYAAAYLEYRFGVAPHPAFAFAQFALLDHLSPSRTAAELLAARPAYLPAVARWGFGVRNPAWLALRLEAASCSALLDALAPQPVAPDVADGALVRALLATAPPGWRALPVPAAALALLLGSLAGDRQRSEADVARRAAVARALAAFAHIAEVAPGLVDRLGRKGTGEELEFLTLAGSARREAGFARALFSGRRGRRLAAAAAMLLGVAPRARDTGQGDKPSKPGRKARAQPQRLESPFAGLALLLPTIRTLSLDQHLAPGHARALILALLDPPQRMAGQVEALADLLLPFPIEPVPAVWPDRSDDEVGSAEVWAGYLLEQFTERLPGLRGSSPAYLRSQFLHVAGSLELEPGRVTARLSRPPLAIVLTIAGLVGELGPLPWRRDHSLRVMML